MSARRTFEFLKVQEKRGFLMIRRTFLLLGLVVASIGLCANSAGADHAVAHNGETAEISKSDGLVQDETVTVTGIGYAPGSTLTVVQCFIFPAAGPTDCELSNFGQFTAEVGDDGVGTVDYVVNVVEGRCDPANPCFVVVSDGIGPSANGVGLEVTFADAAADEAAAEQAAADEAAAEPVATEDDGTTDAAAGSDASSDSDGGGSGWVLPVVIVGAVVAAGGAFAATRRRGSN